MTPCVPASVHLPRALFLAALPLLVTAASVSLPAGTAAADSPAPVFNRAPLAEKPYAELPLGAIEPQGWLRDELQRMAGGMTGHLDQWYPEVCGERNAWLGGDGDAWERGPYWIDGLYPLSKLLGDEVLQDKAMRWIEWTLNHQRESGQIGPMEIEPGERTRPAPAGAQIHKPDDWWPRMVMLKILQQHYQATGDQRVIDCLTRYFRYQLEELPERPLHDPSNPASGSWWAAQRGGDNLMVVLWLYNVTGDQFLLELADLIHEQTVPVTDWFSPGEENMLRRRRDQGPTLHCVNLAQMMKTPVIRWQQDQEPRRLEAIENAFADIRTFHGQPHGLFGGDESLHGDAPDRGSELCTAVEMMFSLEKMFEITGNPAHGDRLERVAFNALPTQCTDDHHARQYFQQTNQVECTYGDRDFFNDGGDRVVYGLLRGYPCCTCNLHQGWPKFAQHLWLASQDGGLAALSYAPSSVTANVAGDQPVTLHTTTGYPFKERTTITVSADNSVAFPLHLRIPGWAKNAELSINGEKAGNPEAGTMHVVNRAWKGGDTVTLRFPMPVRSSTWYAGSKAIQRGPLVYALDVHADWEDVVEPRPEQASDSAMHRGYREARPKTPWNYALPEAVVQRPAGNIRVEVSDAIANNPWTRETAPVRLVTRGVRLPYWTMNRHSAAPPPLSPAPMPSEVAPQQITLIPYGATTLRVAAFPWLRGGELAREYQPEELKYAAARASHTHPQDTVEAVRMPHQPISSADTSIPRWTSWPQKGQQQWVEIELDGPTRIDSVGVYFYDDNRGIDLPKRWHLQYRTADRWQAVNEAKPETFTTRRDQYNRVRPADAPVTEAVRVVMQPSDAAKCVGLLSVQIDGEQLEQPAAEQAAERPNFVFFITDDISPDDLSIYGNKKIQTPNLQRIASQGLVFDNAYLTASSCSPSRCSIITGRYPHNTGAPELHTKLPPDQTTFVQSLRRAGYHTVISGKNHMAPPRQLGFDVISDSRPAGAENWIQHLRERPEDQPFFCWFASHDAHRPFTPTENAPRYDADEVEVPPMLFDGPLTRGDLANFYHEVSRTDHYAGELMEELERQGVADNTYFVYCSDNGRPFPRCKTYLYESGIQTPLVVTGPGVPTGRTNALVSSVDFAATFLELAGVDKPDTVQGISMAPVLRDPAAEVRDVAFAERNWHVYQTHERAVRSGDWLYIWNAWPERHNVSGESAVFIFPSAKELWQMAEEDKLTPAQALLTQAPQPAEMLFHVENDPHQLNNLAEDPEHRQVVEKMRSLLDRWTEATGDSVPEDPTPDRQSLHGGDRKRIRHREFPGAANEATKINRPGPIRLDEGNDE